MSVGPVQKGLHFFPYLIGIALELTELNALLQLDPPNSAEVFNVNLPLLDILKQNLNAGLSVVLAVGHQGDTGAFEVLQENERINKY